MLDRLPIPRQLQGPVGKEGIYSAALVSSVAAGAAGASAAASFGASGAAASVAGSASEEVQRVCVRVSGVPTYRLVQTYQVVSKKLHDQSGVLVALLAQCVKLCEFVSSRFVTVLTLCKYAPAMASSKACLARWQAWSGALRIS